MDSSAGVARLLGSSMAESRSAYVGSGPGSAYRHLWTFLARHFLLRRYGHSWANSLQAVDDNFFAGLQPGTNDALALDGRTELHRPIGNRVGRGQRQHIFLRLVGADGALGHEQSRMTFAQGNSDARKQSGHYAAVAIRKYRAQKNAARVRIEPVVERFDMAPVREVLFVGQLQLDGNLALGVRFQLFDLRQCVKFQERILIDVRIDVNGVNGNQSREQRGCAGDTADIIAFGQQRAADPSVNRRADLRVFEIQLGGIARRLGREQSCFGFLKSRHAGIRLLGRDRFVGQQLCRALGFAPEIFQLYSRPLGFRLQPIKFRLVPARIDEEKDVALLHQLPRLKAHFLYVARNAWAHLD